MKPQPCSPRSFQCRRRCSSEAMGYAGADALAFNRAQGIPRSCCIIRTFVMGMRFYPASQRAAWSNPLPSLSQKTDSLNEYGITVPTCSILPRSMWSDVEIVEPKTLGRGSTHKPNRSQHEKRIQSSPIVPMKYSKRSAIP